MSDTAHSSSPENPTNSKKGLSPLAWVGIGCGGIAAIALIAIIAGSIFVGKKAQEVIANASGNPERFAAEVMVKLNPDMEMVSADDEKSSMTIKMKKSGEEVTISYADLKDGKFSIESTIDGKTSTIKHDGQSMEIKDGDGKTTIVGSTKKGDYWADIPPVFKDFVYPNVADASSPLTTSEDAKELKTSFMFITKDQQPAVLAFYQQKFETAGYTVEDNTDQMGKGIKGSKDKQLIKITLIDQGGDTAVMFYAEQSKQEGDDGK